MGRPAMSLLAAVLIPFLTPAARPAADASGPVATQAPARPRLSLQEVIKRWKDGPVRYVMSWKEDEAVRQLRTVPELERFITEFWAKRDPSPGTIENEFRRTFWQRVLDANQRFRDSTIPGWKTDRGKIFILLGAPEEVTHGTASLGTGGDSRYRRDVERWLYRRQFSPLADPEFWVAFERDTSMDWKLSSNPALYAMTFTGDVSPSNVSRFDAAGLAETTPGLDTSVLARWDLALEETVASTAEAVLTVVTTRQFVPAFAATPRYEFFRASDGSTFVNVGCLVAATDLYGKRTTGITNLRVYASFAPSGDSERPYYATNDARPAELDLSSGIEPGGQVAAWTGLAVPPGKYRVTIGIEDELTGRAGRTVGDLDVPDLAADRLALSSVVIASSLSQSDGRLGVKSRASTVFRRAEQFGIYYEVYGLDAPAGQGHFSVAYQFYRVEPGRAEPVKLGAPVVLEDRSEAVQGWSIPLERWPAGSYRIEIKVTDATGRSALAQGAFEVRE